MTQTENTTHLFYTMCGHEWVDLYPVSSTCSLF